MDVYRSISYFEYVFKISFLPHRASFSRLSSRFSKYNEFGVGVLLLKQMS